VLSLHGLQFLLNVQEDSQFHFTFLGIVYFGVAYGNCQWSSVSFTTNMRSACAWNLWEWAGHGAVDISSLKGFRVWVQLFMKVDPGR